MPDPTTTTPTAEIDENDPRVAAIVQRRLKAALGDLKPPDAAGEMTASLELQEMVSAVEAARETFLSRLPDGLKSIVPRLRGPKMLEWLAANQHLVTPAEARPVMIHGSSGRHASTDAQQEHDRGLSERARGFIYGKGGRR